jgi:hypothetical protein
MRVKIRRGAATNGDAPLCHTCRNATIVRGSALDDEIIECADLAWGRGRITFPVTYCTSYSDRRQASLRDMEKIAWVLRTDPKRNQIGFVHASKLGVLEQHVLTED